MGKYGGRGDKFDLDNHANQLNPEHPEYDHSREDSDSMDDDED